MAEVEDRDPKSTGPLSGVRVVALEQYLSAPYCTLVLADAGAEVIKVERPETGDPRRTIPPFPTGSDGSMGVGFMAYNRGKTSVALDLKHEKGRALYRDLVAASDVVVENLRPGAVDRLGIDYETLKAQNPRLIYATISGFGRLPGYEGPYGDRTSFDVVAEAMSGIMHVVGFADRPPSPSIYGLPDLYSGIAAAQGVAMALFERERTGRGQFVDAAMYDAMVSLNERMISLAANAGYTPRRGEVRGLYPRGPLKVKDGYVAFTIPDESMWRRLCNVLGRPDLADDPKTASPHARVENRELVDPIIAHFFAPLSKTEAIELLTQAGVPAGPVQTSEELLACPQLEAREARIAVEYEGLGELQFVRTPLMMSSSPGVSPVPAPELGQDTADIFRSVAGLDDAELEQLAAEGIIGLPDGAQ